MDIFNKKQLEQIKKERDDWQEHAYNLIVEIGYLLERSKPWAPYSLDADEIYQILDRVYDRYSKAIYYPEAYKPISQYELP